MARGTWPSLFWIAATVWGAAFPTVKAQAAAEPERPNIIIILADDLGYGDAGVQGGQDVVTPNIDKLAARGVRMTDFYANHATCAPSRAGLLLGKYQQRFGIYANPGPSKPEAFGLPASEKILPERLKELGYATAMVGKWHLGWGAGKTPETRGFDLFYGSLDGAFAYTADAKSGGKNLLRNGQPVPMPGHATEAFTQEAVSFIEQHKDKPFFIYASYNAVHAPLQTTEAYREKFKHVADRNRQTYLAMLSALDDGVGQIAAAVERNGLSRKTLIIFTSDNGGPTWQTTSSNGPLNGVKVTTLEGGIRVPTILSWPGTIPEGKVSKTVGIGMDLAATAIEAAGASATGVDGVDLLPFLTGKKKGDAHRQLFWQGTQYGAMRDGPWKLVRAEDEYLLFNLNSDLGERKDLAATQPDRLAAMKAAFDAWKATMSAPGNWAAMTPRPENKGKFAKLVRDYVNGEQVDPRPLLFGGGPE